MERLQEMTRPMLGTGSGLVLVSAATVALLPFRSGLPTATPAMLLVVPVIVAGILAGRSAALVTAGAGGAALSFAFIPRAGPLRIGGAEDAAAWAAFATLAGLAGILAAREATNRRAVPMRATLVPAMAAATAPDDRRSPLARRAATSAHLIVDRLRPHARRAWRRGDIGFIETVYEGVLDRPADPAGLAHHLDALARGVPRSRVLRAIVNSPESARQLVYSPGPRALAGEFWDARHATAPPPRPVYFLHIMKTAGTALTQALAEMASAWPRLTDLFLDQLVCLPRPLVEQAVLVTGHLPYEALAMLPAGGAACTVIRDPVERTLSHHAHVAGGLADQGMSPPGLEEFVSSATWAPLWRNYQARQLAHEIGLVDAWRAFSPPERGAGRAVTSVDGDFPLQSLFDGAPLTIGDDELLARSLAHLEEMQFVGVTGELEHLVARIADYWDRPPPRQVSRLRVTSGRVGAADVPASLLRTIREGTEIDLALFEHARRA